MSQTLGELITSRMQGRTFRVLAKEMGCNVSALNSWARDERIPKAKNCTSKALSALGVSRETWEAAVVELRRRKKSVSGQVADLGAVARLSTHLIGSDLGRVDTTDLQCLMEIELKIGKPLPKELALMIVRLLHESATPVA